MVAFTCLLCQRYLKSTWNTCTCHKLISAATRKSDPVLACDKFQSLWVLFRVLFLKVQKYPILGRKKKRGDDDSVFTAPSAIKGLLTYGRNTFIGITP